MPYMAIDKPITIGTAIIQIMQLIIDDMLDIFFLSGTFIKIIIRGAYENIK